MRDFAPIILDREYAVPIQKVFEAWTDPVQLQQWFRGSPTAVVQSAELDLRVGGGYRIVIRIDDEEFVVFGTYFQVEPPTLLEFTWKWEVSSLEPANTLVRVELTPRDGGTHLRLIHSNFSTERSAQTHDQGWVRVLAMFDSFLQSP